MVSHFSVLFTALCFSTSVAHAVLGENSAKIKEVEEVQLHSKSHTSAKAGCYTVHQIQLDGVMLKEFEDSTGVVFAVSWQGVKPPDLSVIFGSYFQEYKQEREKISPIKGQRHVNLQTSSLKVSSGGQMRNLHGFADVPKLVPACVNLETLN